MKCIFNCVFIWYFFYVYVYAAAHMFKLKRQTFSVFFLHLKFFHIFDVCVFFLVWKKFFLFILIGISWIEWTFLVASGCCWMGISFEKIKNSIGNTWSLMNRHGTKRYLLEIKFNSPLFDRKLENSHQTQKCVYFLLAKI